MAKFVCIAEIHFDQPEQGEGKQVVQRTFIAHAPTEQALKKMVEGYVYSTEEGVNWVYVYDLRDISGATVIGFNTGKA